MTPGFRTQAAIFFASGDVGSVNAVARARELLSFGVFAGVGDRRAISIFCEDAVDPVVSTAISSRHDNTRCVVIFNSAGGRGDLDVVAIDDTSFTLQITTAFTTLQTFFVLCIGEISNAATGQFQWPAATGNFAAVSNLTFKPDLFIFFGSMATSAPPVTAGSARMFIGAARSSSKQWVIGINGTRGSTIRRRYANTGECMTTIDDVTGNTVDRATFVSMDAAGCTVNVLERATTKYVHYLAIQGGGDWDVGSFLSRTDTSDIVKSGLTMTPEAFLFFSHGNPEDAADTPSTSAKMTIGAATSPTSRAAVAMHDLDGAALTQVTRGMRFDEAYERIVDTGGADEGLMNLKSTAFGTFTTVMDTPDPAQALVLYIAGGTLGAGNFPHAGI